VRPAGLSLNWNLARKIGTVEGGVVVGRWAHPIASGGWHPDCPLRYGSDGRQRQVADPPWSAL